MPDPFPNELVEAAAQALFDEWCHLSGEPLGEWRESGEPAVWDSYAKRVLAAVLPLIEQRVIDRLAREAGENVDMRDRAWEYVHRCPSCGRYFDSPSKCLPDGVMTEPVRERVPNAVRCPAMDGRCGRVAGHAGPCVEQEATDA